jgi:subtilisin family serine protease
MKLSSLLFALLLASTVAAAPAIDQTVFDELAASDRVRVVVMFDLEQPVSLASVGRRAERISAVATTTDDILSQLGDGFELSHRFKLVSAMAGLIDRAALERLESHPLVRSISADVGGSGHLDVAVPLLGMDFLQQSEHPGWDIDGSGIKVVVMDSGIDATHADFTGALVDEACFCANPNGHCCPDGNATQFGTGSAADDHGHGTWVSGHILGRGNVAPVGAAPGADLVAVKVLNSNNSFYSSADITAAFDWIAVNHPDASVVNASLGTNATSMDECGSLDIGWIDAMRDAVRAVNANGTLVIASSGNQGRTGIQVPSCLGEVMAIGATFKQDTDGAFEFSGFGNACTEPQVDPKLDDIACFSNTSTQLELLAPGVFMLTSNLGGGVANGVSGTSFAAPLVAGCAALIRTAHPNLAWNEVRSLMLDSPVQVTDDRTGFVHPRLDCKYATINRLFSDRFQVAQ